MTRRLKKPPPRPAVRHPVEVDEPKQRAPVESPAALGLGTRRDELGEVLGEQWVENITGDENRAPGERAGDTVERSLTPHVLRLPRRAR